MDNGESYPRNDNLYPTTVADPRIQALLKTSHQGENSSNNKGWHTPRLFIRLLQRDDVHSSQELVKLVSTANRNPKTRRIPYPCRRDGEMHEQFLHRSWKQQQEASLVTWCIFWKHESTTTTSAETTHDTDLSSSSSPQNVATSSGMTIAGLIALEGRPDYELGFWFGKPFWNQGLLEEALACLLNKCIFHAPTTTTSSNTAIPHVQIHLLKDNAPTRHVLEQRLNFVPITEEHEQWIERMGIRKEQLCLRRSLHD